MKISLSPIQYFDIAGVPLSAGRLSIYLHGSNNLANTYVMDGENFIDGPNPVILDDSAEMVNTIFVESAIYDVRVEKNTDGTYEEVCQFQFGFVMPEGKNDTIVNGIAGLAEANPELGTITVVGYDSNVYAGPRTYIWDPSCTVNADGGCILESDIEDEGRWILLSDLRELPCTYYGIAPGHEANVSAFLGYPETVGQWGIQLPPVPRFLKGTYTTPGTLSVTKTISLDEGVKFTNATIECKRIEVTGVNSDYIADFYFSDPTMVAHSSWFRTANVFWLCGASTLMIDETNYFANSLIKYALTLQNKLITGANRLPATYQAGAYVGLQNCTVEGRVFSRTLDYVRFVTMAGDKNLITTGTFDPGRIADGHHTQYDMAPDLDWFESPDNFVAVATERKTRMGNAYPTTVIDLQGRSLTNSIAMNATNGFTGLRNGSVNGLISVFGSACNLYNVVGSVNVNATDCTLVAENSHLTFATAPSGLAQLVARDCDITMAGNPAIDASSTALNISGGTFLGFLGVSDPYTKSKNVVFQNVRLAGSTRWRLNRLYCHNCVGDVLIDMYPYEENSSYWYELDFQRNTLQGSGRIWFTGVFSQTEPHTDMAENVKFGVCRILNNDFSGGAGGVKMLREHPYAFQHFMNPVCGPWEYSGNTGDCPIVKPGRISNATTFSQAKKSDPAMVDQQWIISDNPYNAWVPYQITLAQNIPEMAKGGDGIEDCMAEVVSSIGESAYPRNVAFGWSTGLPVPSDLMNEDANNQFVEYLCLTWDLPVMNVPGGITRFP